MQGMGGMVVVEKVSNPQFFLTVLVLLFNCIKDREETQY